LSSSISSINCLQWYYGSFFFVRALLDGRAWLYIDKARVHSLRQFLYGGRWLAARAVGVEAVSVFRFWSPRSGFSSRNLACKNTPSDLNAPGGHSYPVRARQMNERTWIFEFEYLKFKFAYALSLSVSFLFLRFKFLEPTVSSDIQCKRPKS